MIHKKLARSTRTLVYSYGRGLVDYLCSSNMTVATVDRQIVVA
jgi:hypothetical protein